MSSSVLRNVIQPRSASASPARDEAPAGGATEAAADDMGLILGVLVENAPVAMAMFDHQMRYLLANRAWVEEFGLGGVQPLAGRSQYEVFPGLHPGWRQVYDRALQGHVVRSEHDALSGPDGRRIVYRWEVRPWRRKRDASVGGLMVTCERFTQMAPAEPAPSSEEGDAKAAGPGTMDAISACAIPMVLLDERGVVLQANPAAADLCLSRGLDEGGSVFWDLFADGAENGRLREQLVVALEKLAASETAEPVSISVAVPPPPHHLPLNSGGSARPPGRWLLARAKAAVDGQRFSALGLPAEAAPATPALRPQTPGSPNLSAIASAVAAISQPAAPAENGAELRRVQEELAKARQELRTLHEAERTFAQREARWRQYLEILPCGVLVLDELGSPVYQNEPLRKLLGRALQPEESVEQWLAAACPSEQHRDEVAALWRDDVWRRQLTRTFSLATADGLLKELEFQPLSLPGGGLLISIQDATESCRLEEQLRATEAKFRTLLHEAPIAVVLMDKAGSVFEVNHLAESLFGHPKSELRRYSLDAWLEPESGAARRDALRLLAQDGHRSTSVDVEIRQQDAPGIPATLHLAQVLDAEGRPHCTVHFFQRQEPPAPVRVILQTSDAPPPAPANVHSAPPPAMAESLEESEEVTEVVTAQISLLKTNVNGRIKECTERGLELLGLTEAEALGRPLHVHFRPSDATGFYTELTRLARDLDTAHEMVCFNAQGGRQACRVRVMPRGGSGFDFELIEETEHRVTSRRPVQGVARLSSLPSAGMDVAPAVSVPVEQAPAPQGRVLAPWPVADLSREKLLLSETHHRIKNHLQIISSLLNLESNSVTEAPARAALRSSQNRVRAIADLHQHLYQMALGTADTFGDFARGLVVRLRECYDAGEDRITVSLDLHSGEIQQEWLMPLALTLNETLSNCFEHAFPAGRAGQVTASLTFADKHGELRVADDGVGLPDANSPDATTGLGLKILTVFAEQMRGRLLVGQGNSGGTEIRLRFPIAYADI